jgi:hypothetical protein
LKSATPEIVNVIETIPALKDYITKQFTSHETLQPGIIAEFVFVATICDTLNMNID